MYVFHLEGRIKPYVRMTQAGKWVKKQAQEYLASKEHLQWQLKSQMQQHGWAMIASGIPLGIILTVHPVRHNCDLDNIVKAVIDASQSIVFENDCWIDYIRASRSEGLDTDDSATLTIFILAKEKKDNEQDT